MKIFEYTDYRKYLNDYMEEKKRMTSHFSLRLIAQKGGPDPGNLGKILKGSRNLTIKAAHKLCDAIKLSKREREYMQAMVLYCQAINHSDKKRYFKELFSYKESVVRVLNADNYEFYDKWYYTAVRELLAFYPCKENSFKSLGKLLIPSITGDEVNQSIKLLKKLNLITKDSQGYYNRNETIISTGNEAKSIILNNYVIKNMQLAESAIENSLENINFSSVTLTISSSDYDKIQDEIRAFRRRLLELAKDSQLPDRVYHFNTQLFPITHRYTNGAEQ